MRLLLLIRSKHLFAFFEKPWINMVTVADQKQTLLYLYSASLVPGVLTHAVKENTSSSSYHSTHSFCLFLQLQVLPQLPQAPSHGRLWERILGFCLPEQMATMPRSVLPEILLFFLTWDTVENAQLVTAGVCRFAFSDILFLAQLHCLRCD